MEVKWHVRISFQIDSTIRPGATQRTVARSACALETVWLRRTALYSPLADVRAPPQAYLCSCSSRYRVRVHPQTSCSRLRGRTKHLRVVLHTCGDRHSEDRCSQISSLDLCEGA